MTDQGLGSKGFRTMIAGVCLVALWLFAATGARPAYAASPIVLNSASSNWTAVMAGAKFDPGEDTQAQDAIDLVGNATNPQMYMWYDDKGDADATNDELALRFRVDEARDQQNRLSGYLWIGVDVDQDGDLDVFLMLEGKNGGYRLDVYDAGAGANNSPSTSSIENGVLLATLTDGSTYRIDTASSIDGAAGDVDADGQADDFVSFKFNFSQFAALANSKPLTGSVSNVATINGGAGLTKDTPLQYVVASAQQTNSLNGDMGGYGGSDSAATTYADQGAFSSTQTFGNPGAPVAPVAPSATRLVITGSSTQEAGWGQSLTITARDDSGSVVTSYTGDKTLTFSGANASASPVTAPSVTNKDGEQVAFGTSAPITFTNGVATVNGLGSNGTMRLYRAETATVCTTDGSISAVGADCLQVTVSASSLFQLSYGTQPSDTAAGVAINPAVTVRLLDQFGNLTSSNATVGLAITSNPGSGTLGGTASTAAVAGVATFSDLNINKAGTGYVLQASSGPFTAVSNAFNITQSALTLSGLTADNKVYDGNTAASISNYGALVGVAPGDDVQLVTSGASSSFDTKNVGNGKTVTVTGLSLSGAQASKYTIGTQTATANITPKGLTLIGLTANNKPYDGSTAASISGFGTLSGVVAGDTVSLNSGAASSSYDTKNVGTGKTVTVTGLSLSGADAGNYSITAGTATTANITAKTLTLSGLTANNKVYNGNTTAVIGSYGTLAGVETGDTVSLVATSASASFDTKNVGNGKTVTVTGLTLSGANAGNYSIGTQTTAANITVKGLTLNGLTANDKTYDGTAAATISSYGTLTGVVAGDTVTLDTSAASASFDTKNAGNGKTVTVTGLTLGGTDAGNYTLTGGNTDLADITAKGLTLSGLAAQNKTYDGGTAATITSYGALTGVVAGDTVTLDSSAASSGFDTKNVGTGKTVTVTGLTVSGPDKDNYTLTGGNTTTADITAKTLTLSGLAADNKVYDGATSATISSYGSLTGVETGDVVTLNSSAAASSFDTKNVGAGKAVTVTGLTLSGADKDNYTLTGGNTDLADITAKTLTLSGLTAGNKPYDGTTAATISSYGTLSGVVAGDAVTLDSSAAASSFDTKNVGNGKTVTVTGLTLTGADAGNYSLSVGNTTANIAAIALGISITSSPITNDPTPVISGTSTAPAGSTVTVTINGKSYTTTVQANGTWSVDVTDSLPDSTYPVTATVADGFGNSGTATQNLNVDTHVPAGILAVTVATDFGEAAGGISVEIRNIHGVSVSGGVTDATGKVQVSLPAGAYTVSIKAPAPTVTGSAVINDGQTAEVRLVVPSTLNIGLTADPAAIVGDGRSTSLLTAALRSLNGAPAGGVSVRLTATAGSLSTGAAVSNAQGAATSTLTAPTINGTTPRTEQVTATVYDPSRGLFARANITITFLPASIQGVVVDASTGKPLAGAVVTVKEDFDGDGTIDFTAEVTTGPTGTYTIVVPRGNWQYKVEVLAPVKVGDKTIMLKQRHDSKVGQLQGVGETIDAPQKIGGQLLVVGKAGEDPQLADKVLTKGTTITGEIKSQSGAPVDAKVIVKPDGSFEVENVPQGDYQILFRMTAPSGEKLAGIKMNVSVDQKGELALQTGLIDPYGIVTDAVTGKPVEGVTMKLYWADTALNRSLGRTPDTLVSLPVLPDFAPNQNRVPQNTTAAGAYAWMVWPNGDYYIVAERSGYATYDSRAEKRTVAAKVGEDSYITGGIIHVGESIVEYDLKLQPSAGSPGQPTAPILPKPERPAEGDHHRYIFGYPDNTFGPSRSISRAEVATIMARILNLPVATPDSKPYPDVATDKWYAGYVAAASKAGIMKGYPAGTFRPDEKITRGEIATVLVRLRGLAPAPGRSVFSDTAGHWSEPYVMAAFGGELLKGYPDGSFKPQSNMTRAEFVTAVNRLLNRGPLLGRLTPRWPDVPASHWAYGDVEEASTNHHFQAIPGPAEQWIREIE